MPAGRLTSTVDMVQWIKGQDIYIRAFIDGRPIEEVEAERERAAAAEPISFTFTASEGERMCIRPGYVLQNTDALAWLAAAGPELVHAIVTDPPFTLVDYSEGEVAKLRSGAGGVWRQPPALGGHKRAPLPRFTVLTTEQRHELATFMWKFGDLALRVLKPGGHLIIASTPLLTRCVFAPLEDAGLEKRGEVIRLVQTLRGGDRPKGAETEFPDVSAMPRGGFEPWGLLRKPFKGTVAECLRRWGTGALRRTPSGGPFSDVITSAPTRAAERALSPHPSLKPQAFMRQLVRAALPLGRGVVLDPFMGGGSTIAAAVACGYEAIGVERDAEFFEAAQDGIPKLAALA